MSGYSAFSNDLRLGDIQKFSPPVCHLTSYITGGYNDLFLNVKDRKRLNVQPYGTYTDQTGMFVPSEGMSLLAGRYKYKETIGKGQSSVLIKAQDTFKTNEDVSIKVLHLHYSQFGSQETDCVRRLNQADPAQASGTVRLITCFNFDNHFCMVFELLSSRSILQYASLPLEPLRMRKVKAIAMQLLKPLGFLHQQNIIHADLKPENILLKEDGDISSLRLIDFGNALRCVDEELALYYEDFQLQTLLYRAPEVFFGLPFDHAIDMWSFGCIIAELCLGRPLFMATTMHSVIRKMVKLLGPLPRHKFSEGKFFAKLRIFSKDCKQNCAVSSIMEKLKTLDFQLASFIAGCLRYDPAERLTPFEAARHPFLAEFGLGFLTESNSSKGADRCRLNTMLPAQSEYQYSPLIQHRHVTSRSSVDVLRSGGTGDYIAKYYPKQNQFFPIVVTPRNLHHTVKPKHTHSADTSTTTAKHMHTTSTTVADVRPGINSLHHEIQHQMRLHHNQTSAARNDDVSSTISAFPDAEDDVMSCDSDTAICLSGDDLSSSADGESEYALLGEANVEVSKDDIIMQNPTSNVFNSDPFNDAASGERLEAVGDQIKMHPYSAQNLRPSEFTAHACRMEVKRTSSNESTNMIAPSSKKIRTEADVIHGAPSTAASDGNRTVEHGDSGLGLSKFIQGIKLSGSASNDGIQVGNPTVSSKQSDSGLSSPHPPTNSSIDFSTLKSIKVTDSQSLEGQPAGILSLGASARRGSLKQQRQRSVKKARARAKTIAGGAATAAATAVLNETFVVDDTAQCASEVNLGQNEAGLNFRGAIEQDTNWRPEDGVLGTVTSNLVTELTVCDAASVDTHPTKVVVSAKAVKAKPQASKSTTKKNKHSKTAAHNNLPIGRSKLASDTGVVPSAVHSIYEPDTRKLSSAANNDLLCSDSSNDSCASGPNTAAHSGSTDPAEATDTMARRKKVADKRRSQRNVRRPLKFYDENSDD